ncbi:hypothetical protein [Pseudotamlana carrageenivorans]|uniref:Uncharacterized protein n=1 Tax=Pseudotamlana carrageenivorans TaxID=2069432 RepID=A0A2I7SF20_9FLAO|nr:hypothetical protein [Tamlana carrageenivorans]AUS04475.1 hypothetical protein C1A40_02855 [Tamlana carrageenivorans]
MTTALNTIKNWFKTGLKPTQSQFWATWDSFWHKDETIPQNKIESLQQSFDAKQDKSGLHAVATSGDYGDLENKPPIPTSTSDLANDGSDGTSSYVEHDEISIVATTNDYNDLDNVPVFKSVENEYPDMATMYADQANQASENIQHVVDASDHPQIGGDSAYFEYLGTTNGDETDYRLLSEAESAPISGSISRTSELVNDGASGTSTYVEHDDLNPTAIDGLSIRDANGVEQFKATEDIQFENVEFDPANKRITVPNVVDEFGVRTKIEIGDNALQNESTFRKNSLIIAQTQQDSVPTTYEFWAQARQLGGGWHSKMEFYLQNNNDAKLLMLEMSNTGIFAHYHLTVNKGISSLEGFTSIGSNNPNTNIIKFNDSTEGHYVEFNAVNDVSGHNIKVLEIKNLSQYSSRKAITRFILKNHTESEVVLCEMSIVNGNKTTFIGSIKMDDLDLSALGSYADDTAAAAGGVAIGFGYINTATGALHRRLT